MARFRIRVFDAERRRLDDRIDVDVRDLASSQLVVAKRDLKGLSVLRVAGLTGGRVYSVQVFPARHRPVGIVQRALDTSDVDVDLYCPVHPDRVVDTSFPDFADMPAEFGRVLDASTLESESLDAPGGAALYDSLDPIPRAGLLNLFAKMDVTQVGGRTMWSFVTDVYRVRGDRIFANVSVDFRDHVKSAVSGGQFADAPGKLHTPPPGFLSAGSFKHQLFQAGVLQLTFFASDAAAQPGASPTFKIDADIDDAGGIGHVFQVLRNWIGDRDTHPYDIHQILTFHQLLRPGYELKTT